MLAIKNENLLKTLPQTRFTGFEKLTDSCKVIALFDSEGNQVSSLKGKGLLLCDKTPFFAEGGGQASDRGYFQKNNSKIILNSMNKDLAVGYYFHAVDSPIELQVADILEAVVDKQWRWNSSKNHSALHITWQANLNQLDHFVDEVGSKLNGDKYQLQLTNDPQLTPETAWAATKHVNEVWIPENIQANIFEITPEEAHEKKYLYEFTKIAPGELVRMVEFPKIITEPCSGTHIQGTKDLEKIYFLNFERKAKSIVIDMTANHDFAHAWFHEKLITKAEALQIKMKQFPKIDFDDLHNEIETLINNWNYLSIQKINQITNEISLRINRFEKEQSKKIAEELETTNWLKKEMPPFQIWETNNNQFTNKILLPFAIKQVKTSNQPLIFINNFANGANCILIQPPTTNFNLKEISQKIQSQSTFKGGGQPTLIQMVSSQPIPTIDWFSLLKN